MLHLPVDTSTWLDLAKRRDGQRWIVAMRLLVQQGDLQLLVPDVVIDEFERKRDRIVTTMTTMTTTVAQRFKLMKQDLGDYGGRDYEAASGVIEGLAYEVPLMGAMTTRNFNDVLLSPAGMADLVDESGPAGPDRCAVAALTALDRRPVASHHGGNGSNRMPGRIRFLMVVLSGP